MSYTTETYQKEYFFIPLGMDVKTHPKFSIPVVGNNDIWYGEPEVVDGIEVIPYEVETPDYVFVGWKVL